MSRAQSIPITTSVLQWAVKESGYSVAEVAEAVGVPPAEFAKWTRGTALPSLTQARAIAGKVKRPLASLLLPAPPPSHLPTVEFRHAARAGRKRLNPGERLRLREASRLQQLFAWINEELHRSVSGLRQFVISDVPDEAAAFARNLLDISIEQQTAASSPWAAWHVWREAVERIGVYVVAFPLGFDSCRGFSIWHDRAPLIAVNLSWTPEARIFTLLHELAHLLSRTNSACLDPGAPQATASDDVERWCERVAALTIIPDASLKQFVVENFQPVQRHDLGTVSRIAKHFHVSRRATALRLIEAGYADWTLYRSIPAVSDRPKPRSGGGGGRTSLDIRRDRFGSRALSDVALAVQQDVITASDAFDYVDIPATQASPAIDFGDQA